MLARRLSGEVDETKTELRLRTKAGGWRHIRSRGKVVERDESGKALRLAGTHRDITAHWEANESLRHERRLAGETIETGYAFRVLHPDATVRWAKLNAIRLEWDGRPATLSFITDITERAVTEETLEESEERFRQIFAVSPPGVVSCDSAFRFMRARRTFCRMLGCTEGELLSRSFVDVTHPDHAAGDVESVARLLQGEVPLDRTEKRYVRKDGGVLWASIAVSALRDVQGRFLHFVGMIEDITARKTAEAELVERERR